ncbi:MAG TPA: ABC transporter permease subunit [Anaerolineaceae bacterium]|nr:ABC transporter permease subunit [Anaerolineaceae bacterium]
MREIITENSTQEAITKPALGTPQTGLRRLANALIPLFTLSIAVISILVALVAITRNDMEGYPVPLLVAICLVLDFLFLDVYRQHQRWDFQLLIVSGLSFIFLLILRALPEFVTGLQLNAVFHRSVFSTIFLLAVGLPSMVSALYYLLNATPLAEDISRYPVILIPVVVVIGLYLLLIWQLVSQGLKVVDWSVLIKPYYNIILPEKYYIQGDWPAWRTVEQVSIGFRNHILGTGLLIILTSLMSMPIGVGAGLYLSEYGDGWFGNTLRFMIKSLRAISLLILGLAAFNLANIANNTPLEWMFRGTWFTGWETLSSSGGSYLTASIILSILIIPMITQVTEEGCRSLPPELREGSLALGVSEETTLRRIVAPWAMPNIITGWLLACAEVAGSVAVLMFIARRGDYGVGVFKQVTSLAYLIFDIYYGEKNFKQLMQPYQFQAGLLLLIITLTLGALAILTKNWLAKRFRGM